MTVYGMPLVDNESYNVTHNTDGVRMDDILQWWRPVTYYCDVVGKGTLLEIQGSCQLYGSKNRFSNGMVGVEVYCVIQEAGL